MNSSIRFRWPSPYRIVAALGLLIAAGGEVAADSLRDFDLWLARYVAAPEAARAGMESEGERLAKRRQPAMLRMITTRPELALRRAVPRLAKLPEHISQHVEQYAEGLARYQVTVACGGPGHRVCQVERSLKLNGKALTPRWYGRRAHLVSKENLPVHGIVMGGQMAVADEPARELSAVEKVALGFRVDEVVMSLAGERRVFPTAAAAAAWQERLIAAEQIPGPTVQRSVAKQKPSASWTTGDKSVLFIRVDFEGREGNPLNDQAATFEMNRTDEFLRDNSYDKLSIETTLVPGALRMPETLAWYQEKPEERRYDLLVSARDAAKKLDAKYDYRDYDFYIVAFSRIYDGWAGLARVGSTGIWINGGFSNETIQHEIGHNLGLHHANTWVPLQGDDPIGDGEHDEYGDPYDNMGNYSPYGHFNVYFKSYLSWIPNTAVKTVTRAGTYRIQAHDHREADSGLRALKIRKNASRDYWISVRQGSVGNEIMLRWGLKSGNWMGGDGSLLLDMTPDTRKAFGSMQPADHSLQVGRTFHDSSRNISVTPVAKGGEGKNLWADLRVVYGAATGNKNPVVSVVTPSESVVVGEAFTLTAKGSDADGDELFYIWEFGDGSEPGYGKAVSHTYFLGAGSTFEVTCTAVDGVGGTATTTTGIAVEGSDDPINTWTATTLPATGNLSFAAYGDGGFLAGGDGGTLVGRAAGKTVWVKAPDFGTRQRMFGGALGQGTRVAVGWLGTVALSQEGGAWRLAKGLDFVNLEDIIHDGEQFMAVGKGGKVGRSADGEAWTFRDSATKNWLKHITHSGDTYAAVGTRGTVVTSTNGIDWKERTTPTSSGLESIAYGGGRFVAVGFKGTILYSTNGAQWSTTESVTKEWLNDVTYGGGMFMAVGANGTLLTSFDGKAWMRRSSGTETTLGGVAFGDRRFVIVGRSGLILESGLLPLPAKPPTLTSRLAKGGGTVLEIGGQAGQLYRIEQSDDLREWTVFKLVEGEAKPVEVSVPHPASGQTRFYRTVTP